MKRIIALGIVILIVILGWTGAWFWGASQIQSYAKGLADADGVTTPKLTCGTFSVSGYPFGFDVTCGSASVAMTDVTATATSLKASVQVYNPTHVLFFAEAPVTIEDAFTGSKSRVDFASFAGSARLTGWRIGRVSAIIEAPAWNDTVLEDRLLAKASHLEAHLVDLPDGHDEKAGLAALGQYIKLDNFEAPGLQIAGGNATIDSDVTNLPDDVRTYGQPDLLKRWQAAGGKFTLKSATGTDAAGDKFDASGTLGLDTQGRVEGQLKLSSKGVVERLGTMIPDQLRGLIIGGQAADGSYSQTLNIAGGVVFAGIVPAAVIPALY